MNKNKLTTGIILLLISGLSAGFIPSRMDVFPAGNHILEVEVNADRFIPEKLPDNKDAYANNKKVMSLTMIIQTSSMIF